MSDYQCAIVLPRLRVQNANAVSSYMTWGFPAMSAFAGLVHALERKLKAGGQAISFPKFAVIAHQVEPQLVEGPSYMPRAFRLTRNPLDKSGETAAIVEEGRMHMTISLVLAVSGADAPMQSGELTEQWAATVLENVRAMRIAGGTVILDSPQRKSARVFVWDGESKERVQRKLCRLLLPGFALRERQDVLQAHRATLGTGGTDTSSLDALLDLCALHAEPEKEPNNEGKAQWNFKRRTKGFLVPIPLGYAAISPLYAPGQVANARDASAPFRFVEAVLGLGEWVSPHRINDLEELLWRYQTDLDQGVYLVSNS